MCLSSDEPDAAQYLENSPVRVLHNLVRLDPTLLTVQVLGLACCPRCTRGYLLTKAYFIPCRRFIHPNAQCNHPGNNDGLRAHEGTHMSAPHDVLFPFVNDCGPTFLLSSLGLTLQVWLQPLPCSISSAIDSLMQRQKPPT